MRNALFSSRFPLALVFFATASLGIFGARPARACGASTGGVAGLSACSVDAHEEEARSKWRAGASYSYTSTGIQFDNVRPDETRYGVLATLETSPYRDLTIQIGAGMIVGGSLTVPGTKFQIDPGALMVVGGAYRFIDEHGAWPFVLGTLSGTFSASQTQIEGSAPNGTHALYDAFDLRAGGVLGWSIPLVSRPSAYVPRAISPYAVVRAFGGPVYWTYQNQSTIGTDVHHFQIGAGIDIALGRRLDFFVEGVPLGEVGVSTGLSASL